MRIAKHLSPDFDTTLTEQGLKNADVNVDGKINSTDSTLISLYVSGSYNVDLPNYPITDYAMYGDANEDGIIDLIDALAVMEYLSSNSGLTKQGIKNADVNADGKVNNVDSLLIMQYSSGWYDDANLPLAPLNNYQMYGDVNEDGTVDNFDTIELLKYLSGTQTLTKQAFKNADVNDDGIVNNVDNVLISRYTVGWYEDTLAGEPIIDYVLYADVNNDGYVDGKDTIRIGKYLQSSVELNAQEKKNADVNADGVINQTDADLINKYLLTVDDGEIPSEPLS